MAPRAIVLAVALAAVLAGCRARDNDPGPGGVSVGEARSLDAAAARLEARPQAPDDQPSAAPASPATPARTEQ